MVKVQGKIRYVPTSINGQVMVTGVDFETGVGNTQLIVKNAINKSAIAAKMYFLS